MIDDRTQHLDLPLPHRNNALEDDVERIRQALTLIDAELAAQRQALSDLATPAADQVIE